MNNFRQISLHEPQSLIISIRKTHSDGLVDEEDIGIGIPRVRVELRFV